MQLFKHETFRLYASLYIVATTHPLLCLLPSLTFFFNIFVLLTFIFHVCSYRHPFTLSPSIAYFGPWLLFANVSLSSALRQTPGNWITRWKVKEQQDYLSPQCHRAFQTAAPTHSAPAKNKCKEFNTHF